MSGILVVSGRPRPARLTAVVADAVPPPPRELPRVNPVLPGTLVAVTLGIVYFGGLLQVGGQGNAVVGSKKPEAPAPNQKPVASVNYAPQSLPASKAEAKPSLLSTMRKLAYNIGKEPTNPSSYQERLSVMRAYFSVLTPVDRTAIFGFADFLTVEQYLQTLDPKVACTTLDRLFLRLQATFH